MGLGDPWTCSLHYVGPETPQHVLRSFRNLPNDVGCRLRPLHQSNALPGNPLTHTSLAAVLAIHGRVEEARAAARELLALNRKFTIDGFGHFFAFFYDIPINNSGRERIVEGVREAGLPER